MAKTQLPKSRGLGFWVDEMGRWVFVPYSACSFFGSMGFWRNTFGFLKWGLTFICKEWIIILTREVSLNFNNRNMVFWIEGLKCMWNWLFRHLMGARLTCFAQVYEENSCQPGFLGWIWGYWSKKKKKKEQFFKNPKSRKTLGWVFGVFGQKPKNPKTQKPKPCHPCLHDPPSYM